MKYRVLISIFIVLFFYNIQIILAAENEYGVVKAFFNGENATVEGVKLKIGEPAEIRIEINSKINGHVFIKLTEPGTTKAFDVLNGPSKQDERIDNLNIINSWSKTYTWKLAPSGAWKNGNAPINIVVNFYDIKSKDSKIIQFTIANPYILDEQYSGAAPTTAPSLQPTGTGSPAPTKQAPFVPALVALSALILAWLWKREK